MSVRRWLAAIFGFEVDSPVVVDVAVPVKSIPFWIADQGFQATNLSLENCDTSWSRLSEDRLSQGGSDWASTVSIAHRWLTTSSSSGRWTAETPVSHNPSSRSTRDSRRRGRRRLLAPGVSAAHDAYKPFQALPAELVDAVLIQPAHADRHSTLLATGRVWKTHVVSSSVPDQVTIAFGSDPARELVWTWRTSAEMHVDCHSRRPTAKRCGQTQPTDRRRRRLRRLFRVVKGESTLVEVPNLLNDPVIRRHRVAVDGLEPDTVYRYSLGDGTPEGWGPWRTVKTGPDSSRGARFLYLGDAQTGLEGWGRLLKAAYRRHPDIDFFVLAGDLVDRGNERTNWDHFFLRAAGVFDRVPLMPCVGNHEYLDMGPRLYRAFFELPRNGPAGIDPDLVYHFECGDACFAVLDSTLAVCDPVQARRQAEWLDATLRQTARPRGNS